MIRLKMILKLFYDTFHGSTRKFFMVFGPLLSIILTLFLYDYSVSNFANQLISDFTVQNATELATGDVFGLTTRINHLASSSHIICATGYVQNELFLNLKKTADCKVTFFHRSEIFTSPNSGVKISLLIALPAKWQLSFVIFLTLQILNLFVISYLIGKSYSNQLELAESFASVAQQAAHDIRSPLGALNLTISNLANIPAAHLNVMLASSRRVNEVAEELLKLTRETTTYFKIKKPRYGSPRSTKEESCDISATAIEIVDEKQVSWKKLINVSLKLSDSTDGNCIVACNSTEMKRLLSNLLNNSLESLVQESGEITLGIRDAQNQISIFILDNGRGMTDDTISNLGIRRFSLGKEKIIGSGTGLGYFHAKNMINAFSGKLEISSKLNEGTFLEIRLNKIV